MYGANLTMDNCILKKNGWESGIPQALNGNGGALFINDGFITISNTKLMRSVKRGLIYLGTPGYVVRKESLRSPVFGKW